MRFRRSHFWSLRRPSRSRTRTARTRIPTPSRRRPASTPRRRQGRGRVSIRPWARSRQQRGRKPITSWLLVPWHLVDDVQGDPVPGLSRGSDFDRQGRARTTPTRFPPRPVSSTLWTGKSWLWYVSRDLGRHRERAGEEGLCLGPRRAGPVGGSVQRLPSGAVPTITGAAKVGSTLTAVPGTWGPAPVSLAYQWKAGGVVILGATSTPMSRRVPTSENADSDRDRIEGRFRQYGEDVQRDSRGG